MIEKLIEEVAGHRDQVKNLITESKTDVPHLGNAAGALHTALRNLEGHLAAEKAKAERAGQKNCPGRWRHKNSGSSSG
jgi:hypothetical protein